MNRRDFISIAVGIPAIYGVAKYVNYISESGFPINVHYRGMSDGHLIRDKNFPKAALEEELKSDICIVGSGIAALTCCWKLIQSNYKGNIILVSGGELFGNSGSIEINKAHYPIGAHYLPLQNEESSHTREMLKFFNIIEKNEYSQKPTYNSKHLVYSPMERVLFENHWQEGLYKKSETSIKFFKFIEQFKNKVGSDGKKLFSIPLSLSSKDSQYLDNQSFKEWLIDNQFVDNDLWNYLNYCCKDDYGTNISTTSAWAGIHYFAGRTGECSNMSEETILTWKNGNAFLAQTIFDYIKNKITIINGSAYKYLLDDKQLKVGNIKENKFYKIKTNKIVFATPLNIINYICDTQILTKNLIPDHSVWMVSNILFKELPIDKFKGIGLSYDNVVFPSKHLGYIFSDNQSLDLSREYKVLTSYTCLSEQKMNESRKIILKMTKQDLLALAMNDIITSYGKAAYSLVQQVDINIHGHAMPYPEVGFLKRNSLLNEEIKKIEQKNIFFAHSDLSGISIFEEASWHGYQTAKKLLS